MSRTRTFLLAAATVLALGSAAVAGPKPTTEEAIKTAKAWSAAVSEDGGAGPSAAVLALTATPFRGYFNTDEGPEAPCAAPTAKDAKSVTEVLACLEEHIDTTVDNYAGWSKKAARAGGIPYIFKKELRTLAKTGTLVINESRCAGVGTQTVYAVVKDKDGALKLSAALSMIVFCGE